VVIMVIDHDHPLVIPAHDYLRFSIQGQKQGLLDYFARPRPRTPLAGLEAKATASRWQNAVPPRPFRLNLTTGLLSVSLCFVRKILLFCPFTELGDLGGDGRPLCSVGIRILI